MTGYEIALSQLPQDLHGDFIVQIEYRWFKDSPLEISNEMLSLGYDGACWMNDWWECQTDIKVLKVVSVDELMECYETFGGLKNSGIY